MRIGIRTPKGLWLATVILCVAAFSPAARGQSIDLDATRLTASEIADRAYQFGQRDDITVITLDWQSVELPALSVHY